MSGTSDSEGATWTLDSLGWSPHFEEPFAPYRAKGFIAGRLAVQQRGISLVFTEWGELRGEATGRLQHVAASSEDMPVVGDWLVLKPHFNEGKASIHHILPRRTRFIRRAAGLRDRPQLVAANIDHVFIVIGLDGNFNMRRLDRYLVLACESGAQPVILLNKADLCDDVPSRLAHVHARAPRIPVFAVSALDGRGLELFQSHLPPGHTAALLGSSGVGKSSLINRLLGTDRQATSEVSDADARGRHTTTHRELIALPWGALLIDTPGMREIQLWRGEEGLDEAFEDIVELAQQCRFGNCSHTLEPNCALLAACQNGSLDPQRLQSFLKLQNESSPRAKSRQERTARPGRPRPSRSEVD